MQPAPAAAASRQLCCTIVRNHAARVYYPARVCLNYIPALPPTGYYLVESMRVWNPCNPWPYEQFSVMKLWANNGDYYSVYTGAITCNQTYLKNWPSPRVDNADYVYFVVDDAVLDAVCVRMRPSTWEYGQHISDSGV